MLASYEDIRHFLSSFQKAPYPRVYSIRDRSFSAGAGMLWLCLYKFNYDIRKYHVKLKEDDTFERSERVNRAI